MGTMVLALLLGIVAGLRTLTAPAAVSWAAAHGGLRLVDRWLFFFGHPAAPWIGTALALAELVGDQVPSAPSRTVPVAFGGRLLTGALSGAAIGSAGGRRIGGMVAGMVGATIGTLGGHAARARLAAAFGRDRPAALLEDAVAVIGALLIVGAASRTMRS